MTGSEVTLTGQPNYRADAELAGHLVRVIDRLTYRWADDEDEARSMERKP